MVERNAQNRPLRERHPEEQETALERLALDALNGLSAHIAILDAQGEIVAVNKSWREFGGANGLQPGHATVGANYLEVCERATGAEAEAAHSAAEGIRAVIAGTKPDFVLEYPCHSPIEQRWFVMRVTQFPRTDFAHVIVSHQEVTERKQAELALLESEERYRSVVAAMAEGVLLFYADGTIGACNASAERILGLTREQLTSRTLFDPEWKTIYEDGTPFPVKDFPIMRCLQTGQPQRNRIMGVQKPDGTRCWISTNAEPLFHSGEATPYAAVASFTDITAQKQAEAELRLSEARLEAAQAMAQIGSYELNVPFVGGDYWSDEVYRIVGLPLSTPPPSPSEYIQRFIHPQDQASVQATLAKMLQERGPSHCSYRLLTADGQEKIVACIVKPLLDAGGNVIKIAGTMMDVTEQERTAEAHRHLQALAEQRALTLAAARRVALNILVNRTGNAALRHIAEAARSLGHAQYAALGIADPDGKRLQEFITVGLSPQEEAAIGARPQGRGILGLLLTRTEPLRVEQISQHPASVGFPAHHPPMESFLGVPIRRDNETLGCLYLTNREGGGPFTDADEVAIAALADYAAVALHYQEVLQQQTLLTHGFINTLEEERRSVAYELHDGLTQYVMGAYSFLDTYADQYRESTQEAMPEELEQGLKYLHQAVVESRRLVNGLRSLALDDMGLTGALEQLIHEEKQRAGWTQTDFQHNISEQRFDTTLETAAYRVAQEALANARKHADTPSVQIKLLKIRDGDPATHSLVLEVNDWGKGFDLERKREEYDHLGLHSMEERVRLMKGTFEIASAPEQGTQIRATFPIRGAKG